MPDFFMEYWNAAEKEIFRLAMPVFAYSESEMLRYKHYKETGKLIVDKELSDWAAMLKERKEKGVATVRLQIIKPPISDLTKFEIREGRAHRYAERCLVLQEKELRSLAKNKPVSDFWLFDQRQALIPQYDNEGMFFGYREVEEKDVKGLVEIRKIAGAFAKPLESFQL